MRAAIRNSCASGIAVILWRSTAEFVLMRFRPLSTCWRRRVASCGCVTPILGEQHAEANGVVRIAMYRIIKPG